MSRREKIIIGILVMILAVSTYELLRYFRYGIAIFQPKAAEEKSIFESYYNPFGDPWSSQVRSNSSIPVSFTVSTWKTGLKYGSTQSWPEEIHFLKNSHSLIVMDESAVIVDPVESMMREYIKNHTQALKNENSSLKYIGYLSLAEAAYSQIGYPEIYTNHEEWFIHKDGSAATAENRVRALSGAYIIDITNHAYQQFIAQRIAQALTDLAVDGVLLDGVTPTVAGGYYSQTTDPISPEILNNWASGWVSLFAEVKAALGTDKLLFTNPYDVGLEFIARVLQYADGVMLEDPFGPRSLNFTHDPYRYGIPAAESLKDILDLAEVRDKYALIVINTAINFPQDVRYRPDAISYTSEAQERINGRYFLAQYLNFFRGPKTPLLYYTPIQNQWGFGSATFYSDWQVDVGIPVQKTEQVAPDVYRRVFQNAHVYWNNSTNVYLVDFGNPDNSLLTLDRIRVNTYTMPPKTGMIFAGENAFPALPSKVHPGDVDGDGDVDIFDYAKFVATFGQIGSAGWIPEDIDRNGKVDIFDYTVLVENFGK